MDRAITYRKIEAGHYVNDETGVDIRRVPATRLGRNGYRKAGWIVTAPYRASGHDANLVEDTFPTLTRAKDFAAAVVRVHRGYIATAYAYATAEYIDRAARAVKTGDQPSHDPHSYVQSMITAALNSLFEDRYDQARAFARAAVESFAVTVDADHQIARAEHNARHAQDRRWGDRAYLSAAYWQARPTTSVDVAMDRGYAACLADDEAEAHRINDGEHGVHCPAAYDAGPCTFTADCDEFLTGCTYVGDDWAEPHPYQFDPAVVAQRRATTIGPVTVRCGARRRDHERHQAPIRIGADLGAAEEFADRIRRFNRRGTISGPGARAQLVERLGVTEEGAQALLDAPTTASLA